MTIHLVLYANREPFMTTQQLIIESVAACTTNTIVIHDYTLDKIQRCSWFKSILPYRLIFKQGRRDGLYNAWKAFIVRDVYEKMCYGDVLYYVDCSQYYKCGFTENIDKLCRIALEKGAIAGSVAADVLNITDGCCYKMKIWDEIIPNINESALERMHVLNSWFLFAYSAQNTQFINDWVYYTTYTCPEKGIPGPFVVYHHTGDQSIFNILVHKYNLPVFYCETITHQENKDKNRVLQLVNSCAEPDMYFISLQ